MFWPEAVTKASRFIITYLSRSETNEKNFTVVSKTKTNSRSQKLNFFRRKIVALSPLWTSPFFPRHYTIMAKVRAGG
jgi:hypothetical protein